METPAKIFVIIVNWNGRSDTLACLDSFARVRTFGNTLKIVVVDNGSTDGSYKAIREKFPDVTVLETGKNLGFTGANNTGIAYGRKQKAEYIWLVNNDTVVDPGCLAILDAFTDPSVGIAGSKIYFAPGHEFHAQRYTKSERGKVIWYAGGKIDWKNMYASHRGVDEVDHGQYNSREETAFVTGCSMMVRSRVFETVGVLDDRYFLYLEDLDYCLRAKHAGFKIMYVPASVLWHVNAGSSARPGNALHEYYFTRNRLLLGFTYAPVRTKLALIREAMGFSSPVRKKAFRDWVLGRFGNRFSL